MGANQVNTCEDCDGSKAFGICGWCGEPLLLVYQGLDPDGNHCCCFDCPNPEECEEEYLATK